LASAEEFFGGLEWKASGPGPGAFFLFAKHLFARPSCDAVARPRA
jgi:hypothetical protein